MKQPVISDSARAALDRLAEPGIERLISAFGCEIQNTLHASLWRTIDEMKPSELRGLGPEFPSAVAAREDIKKAAASTHRKTKISALCSAIENIAKARATMARDSDHETWGDAHERVAQLYRLAVDGCIAVYTEDGA